MLRFPSDFPSGLPAHEILLLLCNIHGLYGFCARIRCRECHTKKCKTRWEIVLERIDKRVFWVQFKMEVVWFCQKQQAAFAGRVQHSLMCKIQAGVEPVRLNSTKTAEN
jgi:hypothetical protein